MIHSNQFRFNSLAAAVSGALAMVPAVQAQTAAPAAAQGAGNTSLAPVTVRGQVDEPYKADTSDSVKFTAPLVDTPKTVNIIRQELMTDTVSTTLTEALRLVPGISFGAGEGGNPLGDRPFIRGYDAQSSTYIDGMRDIGATVHETFDIEQIEVTKGPEGAYGGRGGAGGSINLISKTPRNEAFTNASVGLGTDNYKRATVDGNWLLGDTMAFRLNAMGHDADVPGRDSVDVSRWGIAPSLTWGLNTPTRATLSYYHYQSNDTPDSGIPFMYGTAGNIAAAGVSRVRPVTVDMDTNYGLANVDFQKQRSDIVTARVEHDISTHLTVRNTLRYTDSDQRYITTQPDDSQGDVVKGLVWRRPNTRTSGTHSLANQTEVFGTGTWAGLDHSFNAGLELSKETSAVGSYTINRSTAAAACGAGAGAASNYNCTDLYNPDPNDPWSGSITEGERANHYTSTTVAPYVFDTIKFNDKWSTNLGLRVDSYNTKYYNATTGVGRKDTLFNYQLGLIYKPAKNGSVYVSFGTSSTPANGSLGQGSEGQSLTPGRGNSGLNAADMGPEKNRSLELGTKWNVLHDKLMLTGAIFRIDTTNARTLLPDNTYQMVGKRRIDGFELGASGAITNRWQVYGGYTYLHSELRNSGTNSANDAFAGQEFPNTPKNSFSLWSSYALTDDFTFGGGVFLVDKQYGSNAAVRRYIPGYARFDLMAGYRINRNMSVQLNILNLTDKRYFASTYATHYATVAPGRAAIVSLNLKY